MRDIGENHLITVRIRLLLLSARLGGVGSQQFWQDFDAADTQAVDAGLGPADNNDAVASLVEKSTAVARLPRWPAQPAR